MHHAAEQRCRPQLSDGALLSFECLETISKDGVECSDSESSGTYSTPGLPHTPASFYGPSRTARDALEADLDYLGHLHKQETANRVDSEYLSQQCVSDDAPLLTPHARASAVDWMVDAAWQLGLANDTLFLAVALLDRYLAQQPQGASWPLLLVPMSAVCLWVAAKYEHNAAPPLELFNRMLGGRFANSVFITLEEQLLKAIDYRLASITTAKTFLRRIMFNLGVREESMGKHVDERIYFLTSYLAEASLLEYSMLAYLPSRVAASAFAFAHVLLGRPLAAEELMKLTGYGPGDLAEPIRWLHRMHSALAEAGGLYAVTAKYQHPGLACAAAVPPIVLITDPRLPACSAPASVPVVPAKRLPDHQLQRQHPPQQRKLPLVPAVC